MGVQMLSRTFFPGRDSR